MRRKVIPIIISIVVSCSTVGTAVYADSIQREAETECGENGTIPEDAALSVSGMDPERVPDENNDRSDEEETQKVQDVPDEAETDTVTARTDGVSCYVVNFTYDRTTYTLNGDSRVELAAILERVGLDGQCTDAVSSAPELFTAFSEDEKWYVQAVKAFSSAETLTVTLDNGGSETRYEIIVTDDAVYSAVISWSAGTITGTLKPQKYTWDAENTKYIPEAYTEGESRLVEAAGADVSITVTNKSNASIYYTITQEDLSTDEYTLTHEASDLGLTEIKKDSTGTGSVSAEYKDTVTLTDTTKDMATAATDVAEYVISIQTPDTSAIQLDGSDTVAIGGTTTLTASALVSGIGTPGTDGTLTWESSDENIMTVSANGAVTPAGEAEFGKTSTITATYIYGSKVYTASRELTVDVQYTLTGQSAKSKVLSACVLLASTTLSYDDDADSETADAVAYNGYISATLSANWADALNFVSELNGATYRGTKAGEDTVISNSYSPTNTKQIVPGDQNSSGQWRLLTVYEDENQDARKTTGYESAYEYTALDAAAWARASGGSSGTYGFGMSDWKTLFGGVQELWSSQEAWNTTVQAESWLCGSGYWHDVTKTSSKKYGFVVIWDPAE